MRKKGDTGRRPNISQEGRDKPFSWRDAKGNLLAFLGGKLRLGKRCIGTNLNDLWAFTPSTGQWKPWMSGKK